LRILALGIYGLVLFPLVKNMIDFKAIKIFKNVIAVKINPATAILAETLYSLNHCRKNWKGSFTMSAITICLASKLFG